MAPFMRITSRKVGAFSMRDTVGWEHRSSPLSGNRPHASLNAGSERSMSRSSASSYPVAMASARARTMSAIGCVTKAGLR